LRWCEEKLDHPGPHRKRLYDGFAFDIQTGKPVIVQTWLQGESARVHGIVVVAAQCEIGLTWRQVGELSQTLAAASRRWGE
jgi:hypothetical protein